MKIASITEVEAHFGAYVKATNGGPVVVTRDGKPVAVILSLTDKEEVERMMMAYSPRLQALLKAAHRRIQAGKGIPNDEFWEQVAQEQTAGRRARKRKKTA